MLSNARLGIIKAPPVAVAICVVLMLGLASALNRQNLEKNNSEQIATPAISSSLFDGSTSNGATQVGKAEREELALQAQQGQTFWAQISALISIGALISAVVGLYFVKKTLDATRQAVERAADSNQVVQENAIAERRAWIRIDQTKLVYPTAFSDEGFRYKIHYTVENVGRTLARTLEIRVETYFASENTESFLVARDRSISQARNQPLELGTVLFPGQKFEGSLLFSDEKKKFGKSITMRPDGTRKFAIMFFITASYRVDGDSKPHITQIICSSLNTPIPLEIADGIQMQLYEQPFISPIID